MISLVIGKYNIFLSKIFLKNIEKYKQDTIEKPESGGILLGQVYENNIYVLKYSDPCKYDKSSRYSFIRDKKNAQEIINKEFIDSNGKTIYIGEWHTHPEKSPTPSNQDVKMIKGQYKDNRLNENFLLLFIIGIEDFFLGIYDGKSITSIKLNMQ